MGVTGAEEIGGDADSPVLVRRLGNTTALGPILPLLPPAPDEDLLDWPVPVALPNAPRLPPEG